MSARKVFPLKASVQKEGLEQKHGKGQSLQENDF